MQNTAEDESQWALKQDAFGQTWELSWLAKNLPSIPCVLAAGYKMPCLLNNKLLVVVSTQSEMFLDRAIPSVGHLQRCELLTPR